MPRDAKDSAWQRCPVHPRGAAHSFWTLSSAPRALLIFLDPSSGIILTSAHTQLLGCWASCCGLCAYDVVREPGLHPAGARDTP